MKAKKVLAMLMASAMIMGTSVTAFALPEGNDSAVITINNAGSSAKFNYVQIVVANQQTETGWDIVDDYRDEFTGEKAFQGYDEQAILKGMIYKATEGEKGTEISGFDSKYAEALKAIYDEINFDDESADDRTIDVKSAGVYVIKGSESGYTYSPMAGYVGFGYGTSGGVATTLEDEEIEAKRVPGTHDKSVEDESDKVTEISQTETYKIKGIVPYIPTTESNRQYWVTDSLKGAEYVGRVDDANAKKYVNVTVEIGTQADPDSSYTENYEVEVKPDTAEGFEDRTCFALNLTELLGNDAAGTANQYANKYITISYQVVVKGVEVVNDSFMGKGSHDDDFGHDSEKLYTAKLELVKVAFTNDDDENLKDNPKLSGADFVLYKDAENYAKVENGNFVKWVSKAEATTLTTNAEGVIEVKGLDVGNYYFVETKAPEGYSLDNTPIPVSVNVSEEDGVATTSPSHTEYKTNTKLSSLPSTGGIGTTIFTIGGCAIMVTAAGLYFATRKKTEK